MVTTAEKVMAGGGDNSVLKKCAAAMATTAEKVMAGGGDNSVFVVINLMLTALFIKRSI